MVRSAGVSDEVLDTWDAGCTLSGLGFLATSGCDEAAKTAFGLSVRCMGSVWGQCAMKTLRVLREAPHELTNGDVVCFRGMLYVNNTAHHSVYHIIVI